MFFRYPKALRSIRLSIQSQFACRKQVKAEAYCHFGRQNGNPLPFSVNLSTQSRQEKLAHLLLHTMHPHQQR
jgi:hypothetical protein